MNDNKQDGLALSRHISEGHVLYDVRLQEEVGDGGWEPYDVGFCFFWRFECQFCRQEFTIEEKVKQ